jgi:nucleotidyltransferase substrate binding protein (TIGR01987 family)
MNDNIDIKNYAFYYELRTLPFVQEIWLFGSRSKGSATERSDFDLAIVCPDATEDEWQKIRALLEESDTLLKIDCIRLDTLEDHRLLSEIEKSKTVLFRRVSNNFSWYDTFLDLGEALARFENVLKEDPSRNSYRVEAGIQIFEYTFDLYWKLLKKICIQQGLDATSPRNTLEQAYSIKLIDHESNWIKMLDDRNLTSHTYRYPLAHAIFERCKVHSMTMRENYEKLKQHFGL